MNPFYFVSNIGELYVPVECRDAVFARARVKLFAHQELRHLSRIFTHIRHGGVAVVEGQWEQITTVMDYIQRHKQDLIQEASHRNAKQRDRRDSRGKSASLALKEALARLMCWADAEGILQVEPAPLLPYLLEFAGEPAEANQGKPFLLPLIKIQQIQSALAETYPIRVLEASLVASENVLAPRSQETIECFQEALQHVRRTTTVVADIGCGSGCLTLLARQELGDQTEVYASDLLPEAIATTRLNIQRLLPNSDGITILPAGDLFDPFTSHQFDVILFNAPWVVARVRNRAELAIHDEKQETVKRFFAKVSNFLKPDGTVLLGYADASGPKAIENLETIIAEAGFSVDTVFKRRVATHRSKRKWEQIRVSVLRRK